MILRPASESLPDATSDTAYDAPDVEFDCRDGLWTTIMGEPLDLFGLDAEQYVESIDYRSWSIRFWHLFESEFWTWLATTPEGRFAQYLANPESRIEL